MTSDRILIRSMDGVSSTTGMCDTTLGQELPLILLYEDLNARLKLLKIVLFEESHIPLDPIRIVDPLFLHHSTHTLILPNQQGHRILLFATRSHPSSVCRI